MAISYSKNAVLALDAHLTLMLRRGAHSLASGRAHMLAMKLKHEATQTCIYVENAKLHRLAF